MAISNDHVLFTNGVQTSSVGSIDFQGNESHFGEPREAPRTRLRDMVLETTVISLDEYVIDTVTTRGGNR